MANIIVRWSHYNFFSINIMSYGTNTYDLIKDFPWNSDEGFSKRLFETLAREKINIIIATQASSWI